MANTSFLPVSGIIQRIAPFAGECCQQIVSIRNSGGLTNVIIAPETYVIQETKLRPGMSVTAFYDGNLPAPLIFPPQFRAVIIGRRNPAETITVDFFNENLIGTDNSLRLNIARSTEIVTTNGQVYPCPLTNQLLIVYYSATTRSIPPQTTPRKIIVIC